VEQALFRILDPRVSSA